MKVIDADVARDRCFAANRVGPTEFDGDTIRWRCRTQWTTATAQLLTTRLPWQIRFHHNMLTLLLVTLALSQRERDQA
jgi:hypothetical protein